MNLLDQARSFATRKHVLENHDLYGEIVPYTHHLQAVEMVLRRFGFDDEIICAAAWLHDIIEDTRDRNNAVKRRTIDELFGEDIGDLVWAVTSEEGPDRKIRNALTYPKIRGVGVRAVALKLADRIANVENGGRAVGMYRKEHADFRHGVFIGAPTDENGWRVEKMQSHLDGLLDWAS